MEKRHFRPYIQNQIVLFPERVDKDIAEDDPVRFISAIVDGLDLEPFKKLYYTMGRSPYHPKMMLKVIIYAYMNNVYSCREMEKRLLRDTHFMSRSIAFAIVSSERSMRSLHNWYSY